MLPFGYLIIKLLTFLQLMYESNKGGELEWHYMEYMENTLQRDVLGLTKRLEN